VKDSWKQNSGVGAVAGRSLTIDSAPLNPFGMTPSADFSKARFSDYLRSLCDADTLWWKAYAFMDEIDETTWFEFELDSKTQEPPKQAGESPIEKMLPVLQAITDYAHEKILIVGSPGAGKSTLLSRLVWQAAQTAQQNAQAPIPVLVELKLYGEAGIRELIQTALENRDLYLEIPEIKQLVAQRRLLLLADGLNELPNDRARTEFRKFCGRNISVIVTSRAGTEDLGLERKLQLQALSNAKVEDFFQSRLPGRARVEIQALGDRVKQFEQTPLMVWMLFSIFQHNGEMPSTRGEAYRTFTTLYAARSKEGIDLNESRGLLSKLAFELMHAEKPTDFRLDINEVDAQNLLGSKKAVDHLVRNHLLQAQGKPGNRRIRFCHQSLQEYYAAEALLVMLRDRHSDVMDDQRFQHFYLNYLKWTEPLAMMLGFLEDETQALRVVQLALQVDPMLGSRLAGEVKQEWQKNTVASVTKASLPNGQEIPEWLQIILLGNTRAQFAAEELSSFIKHSDPDLQRRAVWALRLLPPETAILQLAKVLQDSSDALMRKAAVRALVDLSTHQVIPVILSVLSEPVAEIREQAIYGLEKIVTTEAVMGIISFIAVSETKVRQLRALIRQNAGELNPSRLLALYQDGMRDPEQQHESNIISMGNHIIGKKLPKKVVMPALMEAITNPDEVIKIVALRLLGYLSEASDQEAIAVLTKMSSHSDERISDEANDALLNLKDRTNFQFNFSYGVEQSEESYTQQSLNKRQIKSWRTLSGSADPTARGNAVTHLAMLLGKEAISLVSQALEDPDTTVRWKAPQSITCLVKEFPEERENLSTTTPLLIELFRNPKQYGRSFFADAVGALKDKRACQILKDALLDADPSVRISAITALSQIGCQDVSLNFLVMLRDSDLLVRSIAGSALGKSKGAEVTLPELLEMLCSGSGNEAFEAILSIQANCQFYNYEIAQWKLEPAKNKSSAGGNPAVHQHFHGPAYGVVGTVEGDQIIHPPPNSIH
jgi:HEAT repeat protein